MDIVRHYDVDGIHMDFIRYGGSGKTVGHWGYNAVSVARYNTRYGTTGQPVWNDSRWCQWRRDQVTALVRRVSVEAHALKPHIIVSAATICWGDGPKDDAEYEAKSASYSQVFAPWRDWLREGLLDLNCPMTYFDLAKHPDYWQHWSDFVKNHQYGHLSTLGVGTWINTIPNSVTEIASTRQPTGQGNAAAGVVLFSYAGTDSVNGQEEQDNQALYSSLGQPDVFAQDVPPPPMPWLNKPTTGTVMGTILQGKHLWQRWGQRVTIRGSYPVPLAKIQREAITDSNGFFAIPNLPPGHYIVDVTVAIGNNWDHPYFGVSSPVDVRAGRTTPADCLIDQNGDLFRDVPVAGLGRTPEGRPVVVTHCEVTSGSDQLGDNFYIADNFGKPVLRVHAPGLVPPTVAGDIVAVSGTIHHTPGGVVLDATAVRQMGARLVP